MIVKWITKKIVRYMMKDVLKDGLPVVQLLAKKELLTPIALIAAVSAGYWLDKLTGPAPVIACCAALAVFWTVRAYVTIVTMKKG